MVGRKESSVVQIDEKSSDLDDNMVYIDENVSDLNNPEGEGVSEGRPSDGQGPGG